MQASQLIVNEPKVKVDLKQYTERHTFNFDAVFGEDVDNEAVYRQASKRAALSHDAKPSVQTGPLHSQEECEATADALPGRWQGDMLCIWTDRQREDVHHAGRLYVDLSEGDRLQAMLPYGLLCT